MEVLLFTLVVLGYLETKEFLEVWLGNNFQSPLKSFSGIGFSDVSETFTADKRIKKVEERSRDIPTHFLLLGRIKVRQLR